MRFLQHRNGMFKFLPFVFKMFKRHSFVSHLEYFNSKISTVTAFISLHLSMSFYSYKVVFENLSENM